MLGFATGTLEFGHILLLKLFTTSMMSAQYKMIYSKFFALLLAQGAARLIAKAKSVSHLRSWTFQFFTLVIVKTNPF